MNPYGFLVHIVNTIVNIMSSLVLRAGTILLMAKEMLSYILGFSFFLKAKPHCLLLPTSPSLLPDDLLIEIFLCLPAHPTCLIRTSLVCKRWHWLIKERRFVCRFHTLHQKLPVLGFFSNSTRIPRFSPLGTLLIVSQQQPSPYLTTPSGRSFAAATALSSLLAQVGIDSKCGTP